ncbi:MAG TPA: hypothetical protein VKM56_02405 [Verrucomicrobiae bacterium]|nr:hypothetical protein [Verrucomicrobiae bacterium]
MPRVYQTKLWRLEIPDTWKAEGSGEYAMFFRPDGLGTLQILGSENVGRTDLAAYARENSPPGTLFSEAVCGRLQGVAGSRIEG